MLAARARRPRAPGLHPLRLLRAEGARHPPLRSCSGSGAWRARRQSGPARGLRDGWRRSLLNRRRRPGLFRRERRGRPSGAAKLRTLAGACGPFAYGKRDGENSVTLISAWGDRSAAVATSLPTWCVVATSLLTWCVVSQIRGLAWRPEPAGLEPARRIVAVRLPGGARAPCAPGTRQHPHTRQSLRARQPTARSDEQASGSTRPCRYPKRAPRGGHLRPPSRPRGLPLLP
jgi:hypothetical protein